MKIFFLIKIIMLTEFINWAMNKAKYELLEWPEWYYWEIPWFKWVWSQADNLEVWKII